MFKTNKKKIFCIGLNKTGTKSLHSSFLHLGYDSYHWKPHGYDLIKLHQKGRIDKLIQFANKYDSLTDLPFSFIFKELHYAFPDSYFILTKRASA